MSVAPLGQTLTKRGIFQEGSFVWSSKVIKRMFKHIAFQSMYYGGGGKWSETKGWEEGTLVLSVNKLIGSLFCLNSTV